MLSPRGRGNVIYIPLYESSYPVYIKSGIIQFIQIFHLSSIIYKICLDQKRLTEFVPGQEECNILVDNRTLTKVVAEAA